MKEAIHVMRDQWVKLQATISKLFLFLTYAMPQHFKL